MLQLPAWGGGWSVRIGTPTAAAAAADNVQADVVVCQSTLSRFVIVSAQEVGGAAVGSAKLLRDELDRSNALFRANKKKPLFFS